MSKLGNYAYNDCLFFIIVIIYTVLKCNFLILLYQIQKSNCRVSPNYGSADWFQTHMRSSI